MEWHNLTKKEALKKLNSEEEGLTNKEAEIRLERYGKNIINKIYKINLIKIFVKQFKSFLIYILMAATIISAAIGHYVDAGVIFAIVLLNSGLGFLQQYKAEKSISKLRKMLTPKVNVYREGKLTKIDSKELVPGDIIGLRQGDKIPADSRIIEMENLEVNESILTGESVQVTKTGEKLKKETILAERKNMLFSGTNIVKGRVKALVVETGMNTEFGSIAEMLQEIRLPETPMQKKLDKFAKQVSFVVLGLAGLTFLIGVLTGQNFFQMFLTTIAISVAAIPEGLPAIITINLAIAINLMSKKNTIVRRLPAAETLGSVTIICSDKTGTMTEEKMEVREVFANNRFYKKENNSIKKGGKKLDIDNEKELYQLFKIGVLCNNSRFEKEKKGVKAIGDPTESALVIAGLDLGVNKKQLTEKEPRIKEIPFDSDRKRMSIIRKGERRKIMYTKGASSSVISKCSKIYLNGETKRIDKENKEELKKNAEKLEKKGYRVLAFAFKIINNDMEEENLIFAGFMALLDPPRDEVGEAIKKCRKAGIKVKMITGDSPLTAKAVGEEIGINGRVVTGKELEKMTDEKLEKEIEEIEIFARINPKQKLRIVDILKIKNEQIAITGDGVNDVLALKKADIGIAMGERGSDVAREVSDMVLIDDNFASIVEGVERGRVVYDNSKKATKFLLGVNFSELFLIAFAVLFVRDNAGAIILPLLPLQILWMNLITDSIPALALTKEKGEEVMKTKPRNESSLLEGIFVFLLIAGLLAFIVEFIVFLFFLSKGLPVDRIRTLVLTSMIFFELFFIFTCRSNKSLLKIGIFSNKYLVYAIGLSIGLHLILLYTPLSSLFGVTALSLSDWGYVMISAIPGILIFESWKLIKEFRNR